MSRPLLKSSFKKAEGRTRREEKKEDQLRKGQTRKREMKEWTKEKGIRAKRGENAQEEEREG